METPVARSSFVETLPPQMIKVEKPQRASKFETIVEESISLDEECVASLLTFGEVAPAAVITVKKQAFRSSLDTIWEDTMQYVADYFLCESADASPVLRLSNYSNFDRASPVLRLNYSYFDRQEPVH